MVRTFGSSGDPWSRSDRIAAWGLLLTAVGLILTYFTSVRSSSDETPLIRPSLEVATASAKESKKIDATDVDTDTNTR